MSNVNLEEKILQKMQALRKDAEQIYLAFAAKRSLEMAFAYCNRKELPEDVIGVCVDMGLQLYDVGRCEEIQKIQTGNVSVTFTQQTELQQKWKEELQRFREVHW